MASGWDLISAAAERRRQEEEEERKRQAAREAWMESRRETRDRWNPPQLPAAQPTEPQYELRPDEPYTPQYQPRPDEQWQEPTSRRDEVFNSQPEPIQNRIGNAISDGWSNLTSGFNDTAEQRQQGSQWQQPSYLRPRPTMPTMPDFRGMVDHARNQPPPTSGFGGDRIRGEYDAPNRPMVPTEPQPYGFTPPPQQPGFNPIQAGMDALGYTSTPEFKYAEEKAKDRASWQAPNTFGEAVTNNLAETPDILGGFGTLGALANSVAEMGQGKFPILRQGVNAVQDGLQQLFEVPVMSAANAPIPGIGNSLSEYFTPMGQNLNQSLNPFSPNYKGVPNQLMTMAQLLINGQGYLRGVGEENLDKTREARDLVTRAIEKTGDESLALANRNISGGDAADRVRKTLYLLQNQEQIADDVHEQAMSIQDSDPVRAGELFAREQELRTMSKAEIVDEYMDVWSELGYGMIDPTDAILPPIFAALNLLPGTRAANRATKLVDAGDEAAETILRNAPKRGEQLARGVAEGTAPAANAEVISPFQSGAEKIINNNMLKWTLSQPTARTKAIADKNALLDGVVGVLGGVTSKADAAMILGHLVNDPDALRRGITGLSPELMARIAQPGGVFRIGGGAIANGEFARRIPLLKVVENELSALRSLQGEGKLNPIELQAELNEVLETAARRAYGGKQPTTLPFGAADVRVERTGTDTARVVYVDDKGKVIQAGKEASLTEAQRQLAKVQESMKPGIKPQEVPLKGMQWLANIQKYIMNDVWLFQHPANWGGNALGAATQMYANNSTLGPSLSAIQDWNSKVFGGFQPTARMFNTIPGQTGTVRTMADEVGGSAIGAVAASVFKLATSKSDNPITRGMKALQNIPYGGTEIKVGGATIPLGEESFAARAFYVPAKRTRDGLLAADQKFAQMVMQGGGGISPQMIDAAKNKLISVAENGDKTDIMREMRAWIGSPAYTKTLKELGVPKELLLPQYTARIERLFMDGGVEDYQQVYDELTNIFAEARQGPASLLSFDPGQPGITDWTDADMAKETAWMADTFADDATRAGVDPTVAKQQGTELATGILTDQKNTFSRIVQDLANNEPNSRTWDVVMDFYHDLMAAKGGARQAVDEAGQAARNLNTPQAWAEKWQVTQDTYNGLRQQLSKIAEDTRINLQTVGEYKPRYDWYDTLENYMKWDEEAFRLARTQSLGGIEDAGWDKVIKANREYLDNSAYDLFGAFQSYPSVEAFDIVRTGISRVEALGAHTAWEMAQLRTARAAGELSASQYQQLRNQKWNKFFDEAVELNQILGKVIVRNGLAKEAGSNLRWADNGINYELVGPSNVAGKWRGRNTATNEIEDFTVGDLGETANPFTVPKHVVDDYTRLSLGQDGELDKAADVVMTEIASKAPRPVEPVDTPDPDMYTWNVPDDEFGGIDRPYPDIPDDALPADVPSGPTPTAPTSMLKPWDIPIEEIATTTFRVPVDELEPILDRKVVVNKSQSQGPLTVLWDNKTGKYQILDGNHRYFEAVEGGATALEVRFDKEYQKPKFYNQQASLAQTTPPATSAVRSLPDDPGAPGFVAQEAVARPVRPQPTPQPVAQVDTAPIDTDIKTWVKQQRDAASKAYDEAQVAAEAAQSTPGSTANMFGDTAEDLPTISGMAARAQDKGTFVPKDATTTESMFDMRPQMGNAEGSYAPKLPKERVTTPGDMAKGEIKALQETRDDMRKAWDKWLGGHSRAGIKADDVTGPAALGTNKKGGTRVAKPPKPKSETFPSIDTYVNFNGGRQVNLNLNKGELRDFDDVYGTTFMGRPVEDIDDVQQILQEYSDINRQIKQLEGEVGKSKQFSRMSVQEILRETRQELIDAGYSDAEIKALTSGNPKDARRNLLDTLATIRGDDPGELGMVGYDSTVPNISHILSKTDKGDGYGLWQRLINGSKRGGNNGPLEVADVARTTITSLNDAERRLKANLRQILAGDPNTLTGAQKLQLQDAVADWLPELDNINTKSRLVGEQMANHVMLNTDNKRDFDTLLSLFTGYHYFYSRMPSRLITAAMQKPSLVNFFYETRRALAAENRDEDVPERFTNTTGVSGTDKRVDVGTPLFRYAAGGAANYVTPNPFVEDDPTDNQVEKWMKVWERNGGPSFLLWTKMAADLADGKLDKDYSSVLNNLAPIPFTGIPGSTAYQGITGQMPAQGNPWNLGFGPDKWDPYRARRAVSWIAEEQGLDIGNVAYANQVILNQSKGLPVEQGIPPNRLQDALSLAEQGVRRAASDRALQRATAFGTMMGVSSYTEAEQEQRAANEAYHAAGYDPITNPDGSKALQKDIIEADPSLEYAWVKGSETPGLDAQISALYDEAATTGNYTEIMPKIQALEVQKREITGEPAPAEPRPYQATSTADVLRGPYVGDGNGMNPQEQLVKHDKALASKHWDAYKAIEKGDNEAKAKYLRDNPDFADIYKQTIIDKGETPEDWWTNYGGGKTGTKTGTETGTTTGAAPSSGGGTGLAPGSVTRDDFDKEELDQLYDEYLGYNGTKDWDAQMAFLLENPEFARLESDRKFAKDGEYPWWYDDYLAQSGGEGGGIAAAGHDGRVKSQPTSTSDILRQPYDGPATRGGIGAAGGASKGKGWKNYGGGGGGGEWSDDWDAYRNAEDGRQYLIDHPEFAAEYLRFIQEKDPEATAWWLEADWSKDWDAYSLLGDNAAKRQYMLDHPEFAKMYSAKYGAWWENAGGARTYSSYGGGGGGGGGGSFDNTRYHNARTDPRYMDRTLWESPTQGQRQWIPYSNPQPDWLQAGQQLRPDFIKKWMPPRL